MSLVTFGCKLRIVHWKKASPFLDISQVTFVHVPGRLLLINMNVFHVPDTTLIAK